MCNVKSMIILKDRVYCPSDTDSHSKMLEALGICDDKPQADFVKVEITPPNGDMFVNLDNWIYKVDQDNLPDWYIEEVDKPRTFEALAEWAKEHIFIGKDNFELQGLGYFYLRNCKGVEASDNATVEAWGNATVMAWGNATVMAWGNATVRASDNTTVEASDNATVEASGNATVMAWGNATVRASDNATVRASDNATVEASGNATVMAWGNATVRASDNATVRASGNATGKLYNHAIVIIPLYSSAKREQFVLSHNSTLKDCNTRTIYQSGDWEFEVVQSEDKL